MSRDIQPVGKNQYDDDVHPAFAMIGASRISTSPPGASLFDSDVRHQHTVRITISTASRKRDLAQDWIHEDKQLVEVELSEAQWASFVSSMNTTGVPATLRWTRENGSLPDLPYEPRLALSMAETRSAADKAFAKIKEARDAYEQAIADKAGAKEIKSARHKLHYAIEHATANVAFAGQQLVEHTENVVTRARADIEATAARHVQKLGVEAGQMVELPMMPGEVIEAEAIESGSVPAWQTKHLPSTTDGETCETCGREVGYPRGTTVLYHTD